MKRLISILSAFMFSIQSIISFNSIAAIGDRDPNGDGVINIADAACIQQYLYNGVTVSDMDALDLMKME